jgi:hypothetical protein
MTDRRAFRGVPLAGLGAAGVVIGHWLAYAVALPDPVLRAEVLAHSGHGYWVVAVQFAVALGAVGLAVSVYRGLLARRDVAPAARLFPWLATRLAVMQVGVFAVMELAERLATGDATRDVYTHPIFAIGIAIQVLVAFAGATLLVWLGRSAAAIADAVRRAAGQADARRQGIQLILHLVSVPRAIALPGATGVRGPPAV